MTQRINYIDRMKGLAILIVVFAHVYLFTFDMGDTLVYKFCASFEMPLFMFISGFVAYLAPNLGGAISKKLKRRFFSYLFPAFVVTYALSLFGYLVLGNRDIDVVATLIGGLWYLKALAIFVCLQAIVVRFKHLYGELAFIAVLECLFFVGWKTVPFLHQLFCLEHCFFFYPFFMLGYYFRRYKLVECLERKNWIFTISLIAFICLLNVDFAFHPLRFLSERIVRPTCSILVITYLFAKRENEENKLERWLNVIGTKTLDIYMYHGSFLLGAYSCFDLKVFKQDALMQSNPITYILLALVITLFLTYLSIYIGVLVKKSDFLGKIVYGKF